MKKEKLVELGLTEEQITAVMKENGLDIEREKAKVKNVEVERDDFKNKLDEATETLKKFDGVDTESLKGQIAKLTADLDNTKLEYEKQIADRDFDTLLDKVATTVGAKNLKAVKALLDIETLKASKNQVTDVKTAFDAVKEENPYLFGADEPIKNGVASTGGQTEIEDSHMSAMMAALGLV